MFKITKCSYLTQNEKKIYHWNVKNVLLVLLNVLLLLLLLLLNTIYIQIIY